MKKPRTVISAAFDARLGMPIMKLKDQDGDIHSFHFLPSNFIQFAESVAYVADQAIPADRYIAEPLKEDPTLDKKAIEKAVSVARSQSAGYAVIAVSSHDLALLVLRSSTGVEVNVQLDKADIDKLISYLLNARKLIDPSGSEAH